MWKGRQQGDTTYTADSLIYTSEIFLQLVNTGKDAAYFQYPALGRAGGWESFCRKLLLHPVFGFQGDLPCVSVVHVGVHSCAERERGVRGKKAVWETTLQIPKSQRRFLAGYVALGEEPTGTLCEGVYPVGRTHTGAEGRSGIKPSTFLSKLARNTAFARSIHLVALVKHGSVQELCIQTLGKLLSIKLLKWEPNLLVAINAVILLKIGKQAELFWFMITENLALTLVEMYLKI